MKTTHIAAGRRDRLIHEAVHDPYRPGRKPAEPSVCPVCSAVFHNGRWQWTDAWPAHAHQTLCQACRRVRDGYPAGVITLRGGFVHGHKAEVLNLVRRQEQEEKAEHPLHRVMTITENPAAITINTTDVHLPRRIGEALRRAFKGSLNLQFEDDACFVRVNWNRDQ